MIWSNKKPRKNGFVVTLGTPCDSPGDAFLQLNERNMRDQSRMVQGITKASNKASVLFMEGTQKETIYSDVHEPWCFFRAKLWDHNRRCERIMTGESLKQRGCTVKTEFLEAEINLNLWEFDWHKMYEDSVRQSHIFHKIRLNISCSLQGIPSFKWSATWHRII